MATATKEVKWEPLEVNEARSIKFLDPLWESSSYSAWITFTGMAWT